MNYHRQLDDFSSSRRAIGRWFFIDFLAVSSMVIDQELIILINFWSIFSNHREVSRNRPKIVDFSNREILDFWGKLVGIATIRFANRGSIFLGKSPF